MTNVQRLLFAPFRLEPVNQQLWHGTTLVPLRPKPFALLQYLVEHAGQLVSKDELNKAVWPGTYVGESSLKGYIRDLRDVLGDDPENPHFIETVPRRGYRFIAPVQRSAAPTITPVAAPVSPQASAPLVGRERELEQLHQGFERALRGERQIVFITGEPGIGKTTLVETFLRQLALMGQCWIERGQCVEHYGPGEAYLPVLEALGRSCRRAGGERFLDILRQYAPTWLVQMPAVIADEEYEALQRKVQGATRERMAREMAEALEVRTAKTCSIIVLEDLQWSDHSTLELLSYVAQRREPSCLFVIGTYRSTDVIVSGHPLKAIKQDLQGRRLCEELSLGLLSHSAVEQYLTARFPRHQFPVTLGQLLHRSTEGNPLFLVNVAEHLTAQGVIEEREETWQLSAPVEQISLGVPESLRQMIERQLDRLPLEERRVLEVASVVGSEFAAAVVAMGLEEKLETIEVWCDELVRRGQFLRASGMVTLPNGEMTGRYGFLHALYPEVLYERLPATQRARLHRRIGESEETRYGPQAATIAAELAVHFNRGHDVPRAVSYLWQAAQNALSRSAHREAVALLQQGLVLLRTLPDTAERRQQELTFQLPLAVSLTAIYGYAAPEVEAAYVQARTLCQQLGDNLHLILALLGILLFYFVRGDLRRAQELGEQVLHLADNADDGSSSLQTHVLMGYVLHHLGEISDAREHLEQATKHYNSQHRALAFLFGQDPGVAGLCQLAWTLWMLGYPEQARQRSEEAVTLARELAHPWSLALALHYATVAHELLGESQLVLRLAEEVVQFAQEQGFPFWLALATINKGSALAEQFATPEGIMLMSQGLSMFRTGGATSGNTYWLALIANSNAAQGRLDEGVAALTEAFRIVDENREEVWKAELYRLRGEFILQRSGVQNLESERKVKSRKSKVLSPISQISDPKSQGEAETCFRKAIDIAQKQQAKSLELRAVMSLARLWQQQSKRHEAHQMLSEIYNWFTEGFDTKDLQEAKGLLETLGHDE